MAAQGNADVVSSLYLATIDIRRPQQLAGYPRLPCQQKNVASAAAAQLTSLNVPAPSTGVSTAFGWIENVCIVVFTIELVGKALCAPSYRAFFLSPMHAIDVVAILPWFIEKGGAGALGGTQVRPWQATL